MVHEQNNYGLFLFSLEGDEYQRGCVREDGGQIENNCNVEAGNEILSNLSPVERDSDQFAHDYAGKNISYTFSKSRLWFKCEKLKKLIVVESVHTTVACGY